LLRARLRRRGLDLPATLAATALALQSASGKVSAALADATLRSVLKMAAGGGIVAGVVSAPVAALVQGATKTMFSTKAKIATALLLALPRGPAPLGVGGPRAATADPQVVQQSQEEKSKAQDNQPPGTQPRPANEETCEVRGRVLDPEGKPVAGAKLFLAKS